MGKGLRTTSLFMILLLVLSFAGASEVGAREAVAWKNLDKRSQPPGAFAGTMVYDEARSELVMFGGSGQTAAPVGTWLNDGSGWRRAATSTEPESRFGAFMAYDALRERTILFGGYVFDAQQDRNLPSDETWAWDGHSWTELTPTASPSPRSFGSMAYDRSHGEIVLFGGVSRTEAGQIEELSDTWTFDGSTWAPEPTTNGPSARYGAGLTWNDKVGEVVLFGGSGPGHGVPCTINLVVCFKLDPTAKGDDGMKNDTWTWDGSAWTQIVTQNAPTKRSGMGMASDPVTGNVVIFGGVNIAELFEDTWSFDGTDWVEITPTESPEARFDPVVATDPQRGIVLFGGHRISYLGSDTWVFDGSKWASADVPTPKPRFGASLVYDDARGEMVLFGGDADHVFGDTWTYKDSWERLSPQLSPPPRAQAGEAFDAERDVTVVFGGQDSGANDLGDTWTFDGANWTEHRSPLPILSPLARRGPAMTYDPIRKEVVMFGGWNSGLDEVLPDTWIWNGSAWSLRPAPASPPPVYDAAVAFDEKHGQVVMFGGEDSDRQLSAQTWLWDGSTWTQATPTVVPPARTGAAMVYVPELESVVMLGGIGGGDDVWIWDGADWSSVQIAQGPRKRSWPGFAYGQGMGGAFLFGGAGGGYLSDTWVLGRAD
jgi:hypothetical protein